MSPPPTIPGYTLFWSDSFDGPQGSLPNTGKWNIITAGPNTGNFEVQTYTNSPNNVSLSGQSTLIITPQKDSSGKWTSARLEGTPSNLSCDSGHKMIFQGNLRQGTDPSTQQAGVWPAFWTLGNLVRVSGPTHVDWPQCAEWDIFENAGGANYTLASLHCGAGSFGGPSAPQSFATANFNTFTLTVDLTSSNWQQQSMSWALNGKTWFTVAGANVGNAKDWNFSAQQAYFPILNVAVGSNFPAVGGQPNTMTVSGLGSGMQVSYVAVYKSDGSPSIGQTKAVDVPTPPSPPVAAAPAEAPAASSEQADETSYNPGFSTGPRTGPGSKARYGPAVHHFAQKTMGQTGADSGSSSKPLVDWKTSRAYSPSTTAAGPGKPHAS